VEYEFYPMMLDRLIHTMENALGRPVVRDPSQPYDLPPLYNDNDPVWIEILNSFLAIYYGTTFDGAFTDSFTTQTWDYLRRFQSDTHQVANGIVDDKGWENIRWHLHAMRIGATERRTMSGWCSYTRTSHYGPAAASTSAWAKRTRCG
jgi:hypothetical protein